MPGGRISAADEPPSAPRHLTAPPGRELWVDRLRMRGFSRELRKMESDAGLARQFAEHVGSMKDLHGALGDVADTPDVRRNVVLAVVYVEKAKSEAIEHVADAVLDERTIARLSTAGGRLRRKAAAVAIFVRDPDRLLDVAIWDQWLSRSRVVYRLKDKARSLPSRRDEQWISYGKAAVAAVGRLHPEWTEHLRTDRVVHHPPTGTTMLAFLSGARAEVLLTDAGGTTEGHHADWLLLAFRDEGYHLYVVDGASARGRLIGTHIAQKLWDKGVEYVLAGEEADPDALRAFLRHLTDPADDEFRLLEITAEMPGFEGTPTITVTNAGTDGVEGIVAYLRNAAAFAESWETVRSVKMAFHDYRLLIEFPKPGAPRLLTYSVKQRPEWVSDAFASLLRERFQLDARPRSPKAERELLRIQEKKPKEPRVRSAEWWAGLLVDRIDEPEKWKIEGVQMLADDGLVTVRRRRVFGCGEHTFDHARLGMTWDACDGEVEMPDIRVDPEDPLRWEDDAGHECSECKKVYRPGRYRIPTRLRLRLDWDNEAIWTRLRERVGEVLETDDRHLPPGVLIVFRGGRRFHLEYEPVSRGVAGEPRSPYGEHLATVRFGGAAEGRYVPLAAVLADPTCLAVAWGDTTMLLREPEPPQGYQAGEPARPVEATEGSTEDVIGRSGKALVLNGIMLARGQAHGVQVILALMSDYALTDRRRQGARQTRRSASKIAERLGRLSGTVVTENTIIGWIKTANDNYRTGCLRKALPPKDVIEHSDAGYALAPWVTPTDLELADAIQNWQRRSTGS